VSLLDQLAESAQAVSLFAFVVGVFTVAAGLVAACGNVSDLFRKD
jgi:uncharacterized membrane protein YiaA